MSTTTITKKIKSRDLNANNVKKIFSGRVKEIYENYEEEQLETLIASLEVAEIKFEKVRELNSEIEGLLDDQEDCEKFSEQATDLEIEIRADISRLRTFINRKSTPEVVTTKKENETPSKLVQLPKLIIDKFTGEYTKWQTFKDSFDAAVHNNSALSNVQKFNYLRSYLQGDAYNCISGLTLTNENYEEAIKLLSERYGNKTTIISSHANELLEISQVGESTSELRKMYDFVEAHVRSLQGLGVNGKEYGTILAPVIMNKLPREFRLAISRGLSESTEWNLTKLLELMNQEIRARETCNTMGPDGKNDYSSSQPFSGSSLHVGNKGRKGKLSCIFCKANHWSDKCSIVTDPTARKEFLRKNKLCFMCLGSGHKSSECSKNKSCFYCKGLHNSSICFNRGQKGDSHDKKDHTTSNHVRGNNKAILLQTADVTLRNPNNAAKEVKIKMMFDSGAQKSYVTQRVKNILNLPSKGTEQLSLSTFGNSKTSHQTASRVELSILTKENSIPINAMAVPFICLPVRNQPVKCAQKHFQGFNLEFADSGLDNEIDLLIGCDYYWELVTGKVNFVSNKKLVAMETKVGWVLSGPCETETNTVNHVSTVTHAMRVDHLEERLSTFWDLESVGILENEKTPWETSFTDKITRNEENRYEVNLPFKQNCPTVPDNFTLSKNRLLSLREKTLKEPELLKEYENVFEEQKRMKVIEPAPEETRIGETCYLPHHAVIRPDRSTTKYRVVVDASAKVPGGISLNDCLHKGPNLTPLLYDILIRFRTKAIALTADIAKAFLMISIAEPDRDYLRFLWFDDILSDQPKITRNRFARMIFGVTSSPAGLNAIIHKHAENYEFDQDFVQEVIDSFYVDDFIGGIDPDVNALEKAIELFKKLKLRFLEAHFYLRKWKTNSTELRRIINEFSDETINQGITFANTSTTENNVIKETIAENQNRERKEFVNNNITSNKLEKCEKTLGITWDDVNDKFIYDFSDIISKAQELTPTKRNVLKIVSSFYDPLGLIQPIIVSLKILMQNICRSKVHWDDTLPSNLLTNWNTAISNLQRIGTLSVNRRIENDGKIIKRELHGFCDASFQGYGACIYLKSIHESGEIDTNIITSKTRVSPIKEQTIPRLELLSALLLSRLMNSVQSALSKKFNIDERFYWSDSQISIAWIKSTNKEFKPFIENRLVEIRNLTDTHSWNYVTTNSNPADVITRFHEHVNFEENILWWKGPSFLHQSQYVIDENLPENLPEEKHIINAVFENAPKVNLDSIMDISKFSSYSRLLRVTSWLYRFIGNLKKSIRHEPINTSPILHPDELKLSETRWIITNQKELSTISNQRKLHELNAITDDQGIIRLKGRLSQAPIPYDARTPILLDERHRLSYVIVDSIHRQIKHASIKQTLTELRQKFWLFKGRSYVRNYIRKCTRCRRLSSKSYRYPASPSLTKLRMVDSHPFATTGIDNFGPIYVKEIYTWTTNNEMHKAWVTLYTCASSRAILLDIVPNIGSNAFIKSFRRMIARRGCPDNVISDNAKNFVSEETQNFVASLGIHWDLNIPLAPWYGGFFERLVKSSKELLRKELLNCRLTYEEMQTVLFEVEQILNNRPLTFSYSNELESCLTPNHLLYGRRLPYKASNEITTIDNKPSKINHLLNHFWDRWRKEYIVNLRESHKSIERNRNQPQPTVGDIVVVHQEKVPRAHWRLAIIEELHGTRAATVRTQGKSRLTRPISLLYPVECVDDQEIKKKQPIEMQSAKDIETIKDENRVRPKRDAAIRGELKRKFIEF